MPSASPVVPAGGALHFRGPAGTLPSAKRVVVLDDRRVQIAPEQPNSLAPKIAFDPRAAIVECVTDEAAMPTLGINKKTNPVSALARDTCFRLLFNKAGISGADAAAQQQQWPPGVDEIALKARTHAERTEWIRFLVDLGALARGDASTALTSNDGDDASQSPGSPGGGGGGGGGGVGANGESRGSRSAAQSDYDDVDSDEYDVIQAYDPRSARPSSDAILGGPALLAPNGGPAITKPLRPAPPYTLQLPKIKIEPPTPSAAAAAAAVAQQGSSGSLSSAASSAQHTPAHSSLQQPDATSEAAAAAARYGRTRWAPVTAVSGAVYRCLRATAPPIQEGQEQQEERRQVGEEEINAELWEQHVGEIQQDALPLVEWTVGEKAPTLEQLSRRAAVEALHSARSLYSDPKVFGAAYGGLCDKDALDQISLGSVDIAYDLIAASRHSCDEPAARPMKCVAMLCALGDVNPEALRYAAKPASSGSGIRRPEFLRFAGASFFSLRRGDGTLCVSGRGFEFSCAQSDIVSLSSAGVAGILKRLCVRQLRRWVPESDCAMFRREPAASEQSGGRAEADFEDPAPIVITIRPAAASAADGADLHLVLLFKWAVRADNVARALRNFWLPSASASCRPASVAPVLLQRATRIAAGGLSCFTLEQSQHTTAAEVEEEVRQRLADVASKWTALDFVDVRAVAASRRK